MYVCVYNVYCNTYSNRILRTCVLQREKPTTITSASPTAVSPGMLPSMESSTYDILPPKPNIPLPSPPPHDENIEGVYDFLQPKNQQAKAAYDVIVRGGYLHEKIAAKPPLQSYSPLLPPRNSRIVRTNSLEEEKESGGRSVVEEKEKHRHSRSREHTHKSRRHHSHSSEERDRGEATTHHRHRSHSSERERESRSKHSSRSDKERHRRSTSGERERSSSSHRTRSHSSDKKRSHSSSTTRPRVVDVKKRVRSTSSSGSSPGIAKKHSTSSSRRESSSRTTAAADKETKKRSSSASSEPSPKAKKESLVAKPRGFLASLRARSSSVKDKSSEVKSKSKSKDEKAQVLVRPKSSKSSVVSINFLPMCMYYDYGSMHVVYSLGSEY